MDNKKTLSGYLKAYLLIMLITFFEVFIGLSILKVNYAFILAIVIAIVDILPVLGTGAVLVPWAILAFIGGNAPLGIGLIVLYGVTLIARQIIEPRIIGSTLGLHPLMTLASVYIGLKLLGLAGIFIGPILALLLFKKEESSPPSEKAIRPLGERN
jgi:sporulation integral membrane protein YtvI